MSPPREATLERGTLERVLTAVFDRVAEVCPHVEYRLVGTGAALLHGVILPACDVDILVKERKDVDAFSRALALYPCLEPASWLPQARQYYVNYEVEGVEVGISTVEWETESDGIECLGRGPWEHFTLIPVGRRHVPAVALELRLVSELLRDRPDRYRPLIAHLRDRGCDLDLVRRGLEARGLSPELMATVLGQVGAGQP